MKFRPAALCILVASAALLTAAGCIFSPGSGGTTPPQEYLPDTSPENVIHNVSALYEKRDVTKYEETLGANYVFRYQPADIVAGQPDSLIKAEEVEFARHLFETGKPAEGLPAASRITLRITINSSGPDDRIQHRNLGWMKYNVRTELTINFPDGSGNNVSSPALFYLKQEPDSSGHWKLVEWADQPAGAPVVVSAR
ncbi:MAG: hypothetical protein HZB25_03700 [Candidatus Eisenbacteria bacterium]|nr:hypothetical protein [Candidatus Eisenbacteria bacterium]